MAGKVSSVPFSGTAEQKSALMEVLKEQKGKPGALMPVLKKAQAIYGYLPTEVQKMVAEGLGISLEEVYGVVSFYSQFFVVPKGKYTFSVCMGTACYVKGAGEIFNKLSEKLGIGNGECTKDGLISLEACRCIGACGLAPVINVNEDVYGRLSVDDLDDIINKYKQG